MTLSFSKVAYATGLDVLRLTELVHFRKRSMLPGKSVGRIKTLIVMFLRVFVEAAWDSAWFAVVFDWFQFLRSDELRKRPAQVLRLLLLGIDAGSNHHQNCPC